MPSNLYIQQYVSLTAPIGAVLGDEWANPTTSKLYKQTLINGVVGWLDITPTASPTSSVSTSVSGAIALGASYASGTYSFAAAITNNTSSFGATGNNSIAIGRLAKASAANSVAIGSGSTGVGAVANTGAGAIALGASYASGVDSFAAAIGNNTNTYGATGANAIAIGYQSIASGTGAVAIGNSTASSSYSVALMQSANAGGNYSFACGYQASATGVGSVALGAVTHIYPPQANADHSFAFGPGALSKAIKGKVSFASGDLIATSTYQAGIQTGILTLRKQTADATPTVLVSDHGLSAAATTNQIILPNSSVYGFTGTITAMQSVTDGSDFAIWEVKGGVRRGANAAATTLGSYTINVISKSSGATAWSIALTADTTNGGLAITATGAAAINIRWVASIITSEVTYA